MLVQVTFERERLPAPAADVGFVSRVGLDVGAQVGLVGKGLAALRTPERLLPGVGTDVALEQPRTAELLAAVWALAALVVCAHVHAVGGHGDVHLVAVGTLAGLLVAHAAVRLSVASQVARGAVTLSAVCASVRVNTGFASGRKEQLAES